jgi:hypothetical protein
MKLPVILALLTVSSLTFANDLLIYSKISPLDNSITQTNAQMKSANESIRLQKLLLSIDDNL